MHNIPVRAKTYTNNDKTELVVIKGDIIPQTQSVTMQLSW